MISPAWWRGWFGAVFGLFDGGECFVAGEVEFDSGDGGFEFGDVDSGVVVVAVGV